MTKPQYCKDVGSAVEIIRYFVKKQLNKECLGPENRVDEDLIKIANLILTYDRYTKETD